MTRVTPVSYFAAAIETFAMDPGTIKYSAFISQRQREVVDESCLLDKTKFCDL